MNEYISVVIEYNVAIKSNTQTTQNSEDMDDWNIRDFLSVRGGIKLSNTQKERIEKGETI